MAQSPNSYFRVFMLGQLIILLAIIFQSSVCAVEQTLIIDLTNNNNNGARNRSFGGGSGSAGGPDDYNNYGGGGESGGHWAVFDARSRRPQAKKERDPLPDYSIQELKNLIREMDRVFSARIETISKRIDHLEANQMNLRHATMSEWVSLSADKRIRFFFDNKNQLVRR